MIQTAILAIVLLIAIIFTVRYLYREIKGDACACGCEGGCADKGDKINMSACASCSMRGDCDKIPHDN